MCEGGALVEIILPLLLPLFIYLFLNVRISSIKAAWVIFYLSVATETV